LDTLAFPGFVDRLETSVIGLAEFDEYENVAVSAKTVFSRTVGIHALDFIENRTGRYVVDGEITK
jgi:hypothetical protein